MHYICSVCTLAWALPCDCFVADALPLGPQPVCVARGAGSREARRSMGASKPVWRRTNESIERERGKEFWDRSALGFFEPLLR